MRLPRLSPTVLVATAALVVAATGTSYAAGKYQGSQIAANAIVSKHVKNGSLASADFSPAVRAAARGMAGSRGASGTPNIVPGGTGPVGDTGPKGVTGQPGAQGPIGLPGFIGSPGPVGSTGATGVPGATGAPGLRGSNGNIGYQTLTSADFSWNGFESAFIAAPKCPNGTVIVDAEISADINNDDFKVKYWQYVTFSNQPFPQQMTGTLTNNNVNARNVKVTSVCLTYR